MNPSYHSDSFRAPVDPESVSSYAPSVPLSIYRELATELQATKAMVDALSNQNQHLNHQNLLLRQEIHRVVQVTLQLGQYAGVAQPTEYEVPSSPVPPPSSPQLFSGQPVNPPLPRPISPLTAKAPAERSTPLPANSFSLVPKVFTEQTGEKRRYGLEAGMPKEMSGLWLVLSIGLIIFTAFGAGFLIMRPLLSDR